MGAPFRESHMVQRRVGAYQRRVSSFQDSPNLSSHGYPTWLIRRQSFVEPTGSPWSSPSGFSLNERGSWHVDRVGVTKCLDVGEIDAGSRAEGFCEHHVRVELQ